MNHAYIVWTGEYPTRIKPHWDIWKVNKRNCGEANLVACWIRNSRRTAKHSSDSFQAQVLSRRLHLLHPSDWNLCPQDWRRRCVYVLVSESERVCVFCVCVWVCVVCCFAVLYVCCVLSVLCVCECVLCVVLLCCTCVVCCVLCVGVLSASLRLSVRTEPPRACSGASKELQSMRLCFRAGLSTSGWMGADAILQARLDVEVACVYGCLPAFIRWTETLNIGPCFAYWHHVWRMHEYILGCSFSATPQLGLSLHDSLSSSRESHNQGSKKDNPTWSTSTRSWSTVLADSASKRAWRIEAPRRMLIQAKEVQKYFGWMLFSLRDIKTLITSHQVMLWNTARSRKNLQMYTVLCDDYAQLANESHPHDVHKGFHPIFLNMELTGGFGEISYFCTSSWIAKGHSTTFAGFQLLCCYDISKSRLSNTSFSA